MRRCLATAIGISSAAVAALAVVVRPATAAVRYCAATIVTEGEDQGSELAARRVAVERWLEAAGKAGAPWASWRLAYGRDIRCEALGPGGFRCRVEGQPCAISQNPAKEPSRAGDGSR